MSNRKDWEDEYAQSGGLDGRFRDGVAWHREAPIPSPPPWRSIMRPEDTDYPEIPWPDPNFIRNQNNVPLEELDPYVGQYVAWSWDGTRILMGAGSRKDLYAKLAAAGIDSSRVVIDYVDPPGMGTVE
jgi:hypothetical protein